MLVLAGVLGQLFARGLGVLVGMRVVVGCGAMVGTVSCAALGMVSAYVFRLSRKKGVCMERRRDRMRLKRLLLICF